MKLDLPLALTRLQEHSLAAVAAVKQSGLTFRGVLRLLFRSRTSGGDDSMGGIR